MGDAMKKLWIAGAALAALMGTPALAADMALKAPPAPAPVCVWCGWYVGVNAGGAWGRSDTQSPLGNTGGGTGQQYIPSVVIDINNQAAQRVNTSGFTGGVQAGYNVQFNNLVAGVEADFNALNLKGTTTTSAPFTGFPVPAGGVAPTYTNTVSTNWLVTARGRLGFTPTNNLLLYGTGGVAVTNFKYSHTFVEGVFPGTSLGTEAAAVTTNRAGYAVGGGVEFALAAHWSVKAEYLYMNFGTINTGPAPVVFPAGAGGSVFNHSANLAVNLARAGLNFHF